MGLAVALSRQQKFAEAIDEYQKTLAIYPAFPQAHDDLGAILAGRGILDKAMEHFRMAIRLNPELAIAHFHLGDALLSRDQPDEAIHEFKEALRLQPDFAAARRALERASAK